MLVSTLSLGSEIRSGGLAFHQPTQTLWAVTAFDTIATLQLTGAAADVRASDYDEPVAALPMGDGLTVAIVESDGVLWRAVKEAPAKANAHRVGNLGGRVVAAQLHPDGDKVLAVVGSGNEARLVLADLDGGTRRLADIPNAQGLSLDAVASRALVLTVEPNGEATAVPVDLDGGAAVAPIPLAAGASAIVTPRMSGGGPAVVGGGPGAGSTGILTAYDAGGLPGVVEDLGRPVTACCASGSLVFVASGEDVLVVEWDLDAGPMGLIAPLTPVFVNGYVRMSPDLAVVGLALDQVEFFLREGVEFGCFSGGLEQPGAAGAGSAMFLAGPIPGEYHVDVVSRVDGTHLAARRVRITALWPDEDVGPSVICTGGHVPYSLMSWGGAGSLNEYAKPAPPLWRVLVVFVATKDRRFGNTFEQKRRDWVERVTGPDESARRYFEEVSSYVQGSRGMTVELLTDDVIGPVDMPEGWGDLFEARGGDYGGWKTSSTGKVSIAGAVSTHLYDAGLGHLLEAADSIVIVTRSVSLSPALVGRETIPSQFVWGHAYSTDFWRKSGNLFTQGPKPVTAMTDVYPASTTKNATHTLCHELGHNLGLGDLYDADDRWPAEIDKRIAHRVDLMATSGGIPHLSLGNRRRLGWVDPAWVRRFDFSADPNGGLVQLQAIETVGQGGPSSGRVAGIEVPISDGWSYLFEYRRAQPGQIGDQRLDSTEVVVGTDLRIRGGDVARPPILKLPDDVDGDGPLLTNVGDDYRDSDTTNANRLHDFTARLKSIASPDSDTAELEIEYVGGRRPQLVVHPAPGNGDFRSPDISIYGPLGSNPSIVVKGATNMVRVRVHNDGNVDAEQVRMHVRWLPFTVSAGVWNNLADPAPFDVPAGGVTDVLVPMPLPESITVVDVEAEHFCVRVDLDAYVNALDPGQDEVVVHDNWAQSNFDTAAVHSGSPSDRRMTVTTASNPLERSATYQFTVDQSTDWFRVYLGNAWVRLAPGEVAAMELGYETLAGDPVVGAEFEERFEEIVRLKHQVAITSWIDPSGDECPTPREVFGANLVLRAGRRTWIDRPELDGELVTARVWTSHDGVTAPVTHGNVLFAAWPDDRPDEPWRFTGNVDDDGVARVVVGDEMLRAARNGERITGVMARTQDGWFGQAITRPAHLT